MCRCDTLSVWCGNIAQYKSFNFAKKCNKIFNKCYLKNKVLKYNKKNNLFILILKNNNYNYPNHL